MNVLFDSSVLVAFLVVDHEDHEGAYAAYSHFKGEDAAFYITSHSLAEVYRTLTRGVAYLSYSAAKAYKAIQDTLLGNFELVILESDDYLKVLKRMKEQSLTGALIYDALISRAAEKIDARYLVTFNEKDFKRIWPENGADLIIP